MRINLTTLILIATIVQVSAGSFAQKITLSKKNAPLTEILTQIKQQTGYDFLFNASTLKDAVKVTVEVKNATLQDVLKNIFEGQSLTYSIEDKSVIITKKKLSFIEKVQDVFNSHININGHITNENNEPLPGASIRVKGKSQNTISGKNGEFYLPGVAPDAVLVISYVGYKDKEVPAQASMTIKLEQQSSELQEVQVAYGQITRKNNVNALVTVKAEEIKTLPNVSFDRSLQGQVSGLLVTSGNGQPGGGTSNILLRGIATAIGGTSRLPLFVIDGVPVMQDMTQRSMVLGSTPVTNPMAQLNINDMESFTVLKDASAIALYGSKASNGVIMITTKKGRNGNPAINFRQQVDVSGFITGRNPQLLDQNEYLMLLKEGYKNANPTLWTDQAIQNDLNKKFPVLKDASGNLGFYPQSDWSGAINKGSALTHTTDLSFSGGSDKSAYYLNMSYFDQDGIVRASGYKRASMRFNFSLKPLKYLTVGTNSTLTYSRQETPSIGESATGIYGFQHIVPAIYPVRLDDGNYYLPNAGSGQYNLNNTAAILDWNVNRNNSYRAVVNLFAEIDFTKNLKFRTDFGTDFMMSMDKSKYDLRLPSTTTQGLGEVSAYNRLRTRLITTNVLKYTKSFSDKHHFTALLGQEAQTYNMVITSATSRGFTAPYFEEVSAGSTVVYGNAGTSGSSFKETQLSFFSQLNYNYDSKYLLSVSGRRDGSSKFGDNNQYGNYWSLGAGWVISDEAFMSGTRNWLSFLKLRGSLGTAGNSAPISSSSRYYLLTLGNNYNGAPAVLLSSSPGNRNIKWEKQYSKDLGVEFKFFDDRLGLDVDYYERKTSDLIYIIDLPGTSGYSFGASNIGNMTNKGWEISLSGDVIRHKDFNWRVQANWSTNKNKLLKASQDSRTSGNLIQKVGEPFNSLYLIRWAGVNPDNGKPQWYDVNGNITDTYDERNRVIVGQIQPKGFGGITNTFSYRNWQLSAFLSYQYGHTIYNAANEYLLNDGAIPYYNQLSSALNRWQKPGDQAENPRRVFNNADNGSFPSTRYTSKGDYIRLKNLTLAHHFKTFKIGETKFRNIKVYAQGNNLFLWTKYQGIDPENVSSDGSTLFPYPQVRSFSFGIDVGF